MFNATNLIIEQFVSELDSRYKKTYGLLEPEYAKIISFVAKLALEKIANSDAPYHDLNHTILVTEVGQEIMLGKHIHSGGVTPKDWLHVVISLLCHDIGYIRGLCHGDKSGDRGTSGLGGSEGQYQIDTEGNTVSLPRGATDAGLTNYHVERSKMFVQQRFSHVKQLDIDLIINNIERTRFPVPKDKSYQITNDYPGLVRSADLIGQMADVNHSKKVNSLFNEFVENGVAEKLNYKTATDLREGYPHFFWNQVSPLIQEAILYLRETQEGKLWISSLYANVFYVEHKIKSFGSEV